MTNKTIVKVAATLVAVFSVLTFLKTEAQQAQPQFFITWQSLKNYAPAQFYGKILPTPGSRVTVSFDLISNGGLQNLSKQTIYWYLNDSFLTGGEGIQNVALTVPRTTSDFLTLRIQLPSYQNTLLFRTIKIPVANPEIVIEAPYPNKTFGGATIETRAVPYFFNVTAPSKLNLVWNVNGETPQNAENPFDLTVNVNSDAPSGSTINIGVAAQNSEQTYEAASNNISLELLR